MTVTYDIAEIVADGELNPVGGSAISKITAPSGRDALAEYAMREGFADPRENDAEYHWFTEWPEGIWTMVFTNTELLAVASDRRDLA